MPDHIIPLHCILPPHILTEIQDKGSDLQKEVAARMTEASDQDRTERETTLAIMETETSQAVSGKTRIIYDGKQGSSLPGDVVRNEGDGPTGDAAVDEAYDGSGATYDLFFDVYGRDSIDDNGMDILSTVHHRQGYDNAFWNGRQMVYGDGDEDLPEADRLFNRFTAAVDIMGHELAHGVTGFTAKLEYRNQSGALNESMSDVFGSLVKQRILGQTADQADWIIGGGLFTSNVSGVGIRSMKAPGTAYDDPVLGKDPQPGHMDDFVNTSRDNGGVHINSGIPNKAFYVTATELGGNAWEKAGRIWYIALRDRLGRNSDFEYAASRILDTAAREYGVGSDEYEAVWKGWDAVGITLNKNEPVPDPAPDTSPPPPPMVLAQGNVLDTQGGTVPNGSVLRGKIEDYVTEASATTEDDGFFSFLRITPPNNSYEGKILKFLLDVPDKGTVESETSMTFQSMKTEFRTQISFDLSKTAPTPDPDPEPDPDPDVPKPGPSKGPIAIIAAIIAAIGLVLGWFFKRR